MENKVGSTVLLAYSEITAATNGGLMKRFEVVQFKAVN